MKVLTMMAGEFDYYDNFSYDATSDDNAQGSSQILFILAFGLMTIIIMNLLIGLTVSKLDELKKQANIIRLEKMVSLVASAHDIFKSTTRTFPKRFSKSGELKLINRGKIFPLLKSHIRSSKSNIESDQDEPQDSLSTTKVCFKPNSTKYSYTEELHKTRFEYHSWPLYIFNKYKREPDKELPISLPPMIVDKLVNLLVEKEKKRRTTKLRVINEETTQFIKEPDS